MSSPRYELSPGVGFLFPESHRIPNRILQRTTPVPVVNIPGEKNAANIKIATRDKESRGKYRENECQETQGVQGFEGAHICEAGGQESVCEETVHPEENFYACDTRVVYIKCA